MDGFEVCQAIRTELGLRELPLLRTTAISWGSVDLPALLERRFDAHFLPKGSLASAYIVTLHDLLGGPMMNDLSHDDRVRLAARLSGQKTLVDEDLRDLRLGLEEIIRAQDLTRKFESEIDTKLALRFTLGGSTPVRCSGTIVRKRQDQSSLFAYCVMFTDFVDDADAAIKYFIHKHVNFREYFRWMKRKYFDWP